LCGEQLAAVASVFSTLHFSLFTFHSPFVGSQPQARQGTITIDAPQRQRTRLA
jgi:hypothetical protein